MNAAVNFALQQAGRFQDAEMLGNGGKGDGKGGGQFGDGGVAAGEAGQDGSPSGIGKSAKGGVERGAGSGWRIVNHVV
jgi:hypothetical protein